MEGRNHHRWSLWSRTLCCLFLCGCLNRLPLSAEDFRDLVNGYRSTPLLRCSNLDKLAEWYANEFTAKDTVSHFFRSADAKVEAANRIAPGFGLCHSGELLSWYDTWGDKLSEKEALGGFRISSAHWTALINPIHHYIGWAFNKAGNIMVVYVSEDQWK